MGATARREVSRGAQSDPVLALWRGACEAVGSEFGLVLSLQLGANLIGGGEVGEDVLHVV